MPSEYTAAVANGDATTARDYIMRCAKHFAQSPEVYDGYAKAKEEAANEIVRLTSLSVEQKQREADEARRASADRAVKAADERRVRVNAYNRMIAKVNAWDAPTWAHEELKRFAIRQLEEARDEDLGRTTSTNGAAEAVGPACSMSITHPAGESSEAYVWRRIAELSRDIEFQTRRHEHEVQRAADAAAWISALEDSL